MRTIGGHRAGRLTLVLMGGVVVASLVAGLTGPPGMEDAVLGFVESSQTADGGDYVPPGAPARSALQRAVLAVGAGNEDEAAGLLTAHGYRLAEAEDVRLLVPDVVPDGRGWGLFAVRPGGAPLVIEVPHPRADRFTEHLGAALAERVGAQYLLVAGARRDRAQGSADVAHRESSVFAGVHEALAEQGLPAVQVHGFATSSSPGNDVVVSPGSAALSPLVRRVADAVEAAGLRTCRVWREDCGRLEGRTNTQAAASARSGADFVHLEVAAGVREDRTRREALVTALAGVLAPPAG